MHSSCVRELTWWATLFQLSWCSSRPCGYVSVSGEPAAGRAVPHLQQEQRLLVCPRLHGTVLFTIHTPLQAVGEGLTVKPSDPCVSADPHPTTPSSPKVSVRLFLFLSCFLWQLNELLRGRLSGLGGWQGLHTHWCVHLPVWVWREMREREG